jgi:hypothetical protein
MNAANFAALLATAALALGATMALANATSEQAAILGGPTLTPVGAERAGNADGSIPAWTGEANAVTAGDLYADDPVLFTINAANLDEHADKLSPGQRALLQQYPDSWYLNVYRTRRSAVYPQFVYDALQVNATQAQLVSEGLGGVRNASISSPFPVPQQGVEVIWNHNLRWRGVSTERLNGQAAVTRNKGLYRVIVLQEQLAIPYAHKVPTEFERMHPDISFAFRQKLLAPGANAGFGQLVLEPLDYTESRRQSWIYNPNLRRVMRNPASGYDSPAPRSEGLRFQDENDLFNGSPALFNWTLLGKREMYIPYNSYRLHGPDVSNSDILLNDHINPQLARYELHRVWVVEGMVRSAERNSGTLDPERRGHVYSRRVFYIDEDTWQIAVSEGYGEDGKLRRVSEGHMLNYAEVSVPWYTLEVSYDFKANRYLASGLDNDLPPIRFSDEINANKFSPLALDYYVR